MRRALWLVVAATGIFLLSAVLAFTSFNKALDKSENAIAQINAEREARAQVVAEIVRYTCSSNNRQDLLLATLIAATIEDKQQFGDGINLADLSPEARAVVSAIREVQRATTEAGGSVQERLFAAKLEELRDTANCGEFVQSYLTGTPLNAR